MTKRKRQGFPTLSKRKAVPYTNLRERENQRALIDIIELFSNGYINNYIRHKKNSNVIQDAIDFKR